MAKRLVAIAAVLGLVIGLFAGAIGSASAEQVPGSNVTAVFFPWVPNGETMDGVGPYYGSVTIQNVENFRVNIAFGPTAGGVNPTLMTTLEAHASKTFTAKQLGISGTGGGVVARATWWFDAQNSIMPPACSATTTTSEDVTRGDTPNTADVLATGNIVSVDSVTDDSTGATYSSPADYVYSNGTIDWSPSGSEPAPGDSYTVDMTVATCLRGPQIAGTEKQAAPSASGTNTNMTTSSNLSVDGYTGMPDTDVAWGPASSFCNLAVNNLPGGLVSPGTTCNNLGQYVLGIPVSLITGHSGEIGFDGHSYLPIVQAGWSGWDSFIHLTNVDASSGSFAAAEIHFYNADQGIGNTAIAVDELTIPSGGSVTVDVSSYLAGLGITTPFVGSAWITSDYGVVAQASRVKAATSMTLSNTSAPSLFATTSLDSGALGALGALPYNPLLTPVGSSANPGFQMYAPLVYKDYNGWNTGINVANISEITNQVTVTLYNRDGTAVGSYTDAIPAKGMHYFYWPTSQDQGLGNGDFGSAVISGQLPFHAAVDEVKYGANGGNQAMSYIATAANVTDLSSLCPPDFRGIVGACARGNTLSLPLFQKGNGSHGDNSGINLFNPRGVSVNGSVNFYLPSGALETPSTAGSVPFSIPAYGQTYVYAPNMAQMTPGATLSAVVTANFNANDPVSALGSIVAVSNNVNYDVAGDGSSVFNLVNQNGNFRFVCSQSNCGLLVQGPGGTLFIIPPVY